MAAEVCNFAKSSKTFGTLQHNNNSTYLSNPHISVKFRGHSANRLAKLDIRYSNDSF